MCSVVYSKRLSFLLQPHNFILSCHYPLPEGIDGHSWFVQFKKRQSTLIDVILSSMNFGHNLLSFLWLNWCVWGLAFCYMHFLLLLLFLGELNDVWTQPVTPQAPCTAEGWKDNWNKRPQIAVTNMNVSYPWIQGYRSALCPVLLNSRHPILLVKFPCP